MLAPLFETPKRRLVGDTGVIVEFGDEIAPEINRKVRTMTFALDREHPTGVREVIPTYRSLMIVYDPLEVDLDRLMGLLTDLEQRLDETKMPPPRLVEIPVCYGGEFGPDIEFIANTHGLTVDDVIRIHSGTEYQIYMMGFSPGFAYLGGLPKALHTPRLETPRAMVPAGSVGIANEQTGMYPLESPAGWRIIGRTPLKLFDPARSNPFLYDAGDMIRFVTISAEEFRRMAEEERR
ncbi:MAG: 5-oxoprolinase subunit PxpB [Desulfomonile sp.]|nr:5-oxoprolinase subunit PxpB [Desulfomonile sp.]